MTYRFALFAIACSLAACTRSADLPASLVATDTEAEFDTLADASLSRRTFTFTNVGLQTTKPLSVELRGDVANFAVDWDGCTGAMLEQDGHCDVVVRLDGNEPGAFDGELRVFADAPLAVSVLLHGKVAPASLTLTPVGSSAIDVGQGQMAILAFTVHNVGGAPSGVVRVMRSSTPFDVLGGDCDGTTLAGGASCTVELAHTVASDAAVGTTSGTLEVTAMPGGDLTATPALTVHSSGVLAVSSVAFGSVPTLTSTQRVLTVSNQGTVESGAIAVHLVSNEMYGPFSITSDGCTGKSLAVGKACNVAVSVELTDAMSHTAMVTATSPNVTGGSGMVNAVGVRAHWTILISSAGAGSGKLQYGSDAPLQLTSLGDRFLIPNGQPSQVMMALPDSGSTFGGWSGTAPCSGTGACAAFTGADNSDLTLVATFGH